MSRALYQYSGLRFWDEREIALRETYISSLSRELRGALLALNPAWSFARIEGPCLAPDWTINPEYSESDVFVTNHKGFRLRAETTNSSYTYARHLMQQGKRWRPPLCVWQAGKSFRRETNDGASASKLRFNEFWQLEFQCIYRDDTKADVRAAAMQAIMDALSMLGVDCKAEESDRLPSYSESTLDIMTYWRDGRLVEIASCSIRSDFDEGFKVAEIAIGLDRLVEIKTGA